MLRMCPDLRSLSVFSFLLLAGCEGASDDSRRTNAAEGEARELLRVLVADPASSGLRDVEDKVLQGLPVRAAELLRSAVLGASERQVERVAAVQLSEPEVAGLRRAAVSALRLRSAALGEYAELLDRGRVEDLQLAECLGKQREAAHQLSEVMLDLEDLSNLSRSSD